MKMHKQLNLGNRASYKTHTLQNALTSMMSRSTI